MEKLHLGKGATEVDEKWILKNVPKKYWKAIDGIERGGIDGWWLHLKNGYISTTTDTHSIHEYNVADFKKEFKTIVEEPEEVEEETAETEEKHPYTFEELMEVARKAETKEEKEIASYMLYTTADLVQMIRTKKKQLKHIDERLNAKNFIIPYHEKPNWKKSKKEAEKVIKYATAELEKRKK